MPADTDLAEQMNILRAIKAGLTALEPLIAAHTEKVARAGVDPHPDSDGQQGEHRLRPGARTWDFDSI